MVGWLVLGALRAPMVARAYFDAAHGAGASVANVEITGAIPLIPPFWGVSIDGDVKEPGPNGQGYRSAMLLCIEPFTGWVLVCGSG